MIRLSTGAHATDYRRGTLIPCINLLSPPFVPVGRAGCTLLGELESMLNLTVLGIGRGRSRKTLHAIEVVLGVIYSNYPDLP